MKKPTKTQNVEFVKHAEDVAFGAVLAIEDQLELIEEHIDVLCAAYPANAALMRKAFEQIKSGALNATDAMVCMYQERTE